MQAKTTPPQEKLPSRLAVLKPDVTLKPLATPQARLRLSKASVVVLPWVRAWQSLPQAAQVPKKPLLQLAQLVGLWIAQWPLNALHRRLATWPRLAMH